MAKLLISAAHKSSGKTTVSIGLCAAWHAAGCRVQSFKKGPDYIDPLWLQQASTRPCYNLDFFTQELDEIRHTFTSHAYGSGIALIEGNKGLYDGVDLLGSNSSAALARHLDCPVVLVIDTQGITRSVAPLLLGFQDFDKDVDIAGVILNKVGGSRHESKLRNVIEHYTDIPVFGAIQRDKTLEISERHLGLIPANESDEADRLIAHLGKTMSSQIDVDALLAVARTKPIEPDNTEPETIQNKEKLRIGITRDAAFGFYYADDIDTFHRESEPIFIDTLHDNTLPAIDGLFIGGGFPETQMQALEHNSTLRQAIAGAIEAGLPVYAECGGMMYLTDSITWHNAHHKMTGVIPAKTIMHDRPQGRGYVRLRENSNFPWPEYPGSKELNGHEFHYSALADISPQCKFVYDVSRGTGIIDAQDGIVYKNVLATYAHQRHTRNNPWIHRFLSFVSSVKNEQHPSLHLSARDIL